MNQPTLNRSPEEIAEIERHKYYLSEDAGYDVGWELAERDWEEHHGKKFRKDCGPSVPVAAQETRPFFRRLLSRFR